MAKLVEPGTVLRSARLEPAHARRATWRNWGKALRAFESTAVRYRIDTG